MGENWAAPSSTSGAFRLLDRTIERNIAGASKGVTHPAKRLKHDGNQVVTHNRQPQAAAQECHMKTDSFRLNGYLFNFQRAEGKKVAGRKKCGTLY